MDNGGCLCFKLREKRPVFIGAVTGAKHQQVIAKTHKTASGNALLIVESGQKAADAVADATKQ